MPLNQQAFRDGSLGVLGSLPPAYARQDGILGALPPSGASKSGILGVLGAPPVSGSYHSGVLGAPSYAPSYRDGSLGEYFAQSGLGAAPPMSTMLVALAGLGAVATIWWAMNRRHA